MMNLVWLRSLLMVMEHGSFQAAAQALQLAQPTITQHIQKLENDLGVLLIRRSRAGCLPTEAALKLKPYALSLMRVSQRALNALGRGGQHPCRVGASSNIGIYMLPPYVQNFLHQNAPHNLDLVIDRNPAIAQQLDDGELDIALMEWWDDRPGLTARCWRVEPMVLIVSPEHPWAGRDIITREELAAATLLGGESGSGTGRLLRRYLEAGSSTVLSGPKVGRQLGSTEAVKQAVRAGLGISLVLEATVQHEIETGVLHRIRLEEPPLAKEIHIVWRCSGRGMDDPPPFAAHLLAAA